MRTCSLLTRLFVVCALTIGIGTTTRAEASYADGERVWEALDVDLRLDLQIFMSAAGFWYGVPNVSYSDRLHETVRTIQRARGVRATGVLSPDDVEFIVTNGGRVLDGWGLSEAYHPDRYSTLVVPLALGLEAERTREGALVRTPDNRFRLSFETYPVASLETSYAALRDEMLRSGDTLELSVLRDDFFALSGSQGPYHRYVRFHRDGSGLTGFDMNWSSDEAPIYGERLAVVISGSFRASMIGAPFPRFDPARYPWDNAPGPVAALPTEQGSADVGNDSDDDVEIRTGTGFFVGDDGTILTNAHVVAGCTQIFVRDADGRIDGEARLVARDTAADLALLTTRLEGVDPVPLRLDVRLGERVSVFGFPLAGVLASSGSFTLGNVTALAGPGDDESRIQISAPVQPGNSGGPLLDEAGAVVGVVVARLAPRTASLGDLPQNVNFAIAADDVLGFLERNGVLVDLARRGAPLEPDVVAERAQRLSAFVMCE